MSHNPYAPPRAGVEGSGSQANPDDPAPNQKLYSVNQIAVATFLGVPLAGGWLFAANQKALGNTRGARLSWIWGVAGTIAAMGIAFVLPEKVPNVVLPLAISMAARGFAEVKHGGILSRHVGAGGQMESWWKTLGISLLCAVVVVAVIFGAVLALAEIGGIQI